MVEPITTTALVVKGICWVCATLGIGYCAKKGHDAYSKHSKRQKEKLALKGKSIEQAQKENEKYQKEVDDLKKKYEENEQKIKDLENEAKDARNKSKDPNIPEEERIAWRKKAEYYEDQINILRRNNGSILDSIKGLGSRIKDNSKVISGNLSNLDDKHWIWDLITFENILIVAGVCIVWKILLKDDNKK